MFQAGDVISYQEMCLVEHGTLQRGMNFRFQQGPSILLMSVRRGAPYSDKFEDEGKTLIYEGHDVAGVRNRKKLDQPLRTPSGRPTQNALFFDAARKASQGTAEPELVKVYEKIRDGIWVFNGYFDLVDGWTELSHARKVFKFKLVLSSRTGASSQPLTLQHSRLIPSVVKQEVWKRDRGQCVLCGSKQNLHFDHDLPFSLGGTSLSAKNIRLLCAGHNLAKAARIE